MEEILQSSDRFVKTVSETARRAGPKPGVRWLSIALAAVLALAVFVLLSVLLSAVLGDSFEVGKRVPGREIEDIVVSDGRALDPPPDTEFLSGPPKILYVYLVGAEPTSGDLRVGVETTGRTTAFSWLFASKPRLRVGDEREERLVREGGKVSSVVRCSIRSDDGETLSPGNYTVTARAVRGEGVIAEKSFVVRD